MPNTAPRLNTSSDQLWAVATMVLAAASVILVIARAYDVGAVVAALGVAAGGWSMLVSRTITERWETVISTVLAAVVLAACLAFGSGFSV